MTHETTAIVGQSNATPALSIVGARVLVDGRFEEAVIRIEAGRIAEISGSDGGGTEERIDGRGLLLLPGIVDIHGDAFERSLMPRPGVLFPPELAFDEADRLMAGFGITTALHGVTYSWEPGLRGRDNFLALPPEIRDVRCDDCPTCPVRCPRGVQVTRRLRRAQELLA